MPANSLFHLRTHAACTALLVVAAFALLGLTSTAHAIDYSEVKTRNAEFIKAAQVATAAGRASSGAIAIHPSGTIRRILPYDANLAVAGMLRAGTAYCPSARAWLDWYVRHLNWPDRFGAYATVYDWQIDAGTLTEAPVLAGGQPNYDSADSYSATFVSAARRYVSVCGTEARSWVNAQKAAIVAIGHVMTDPLMLSAQGLTWAKPDYRVLFNMDNSEVHQGLLDAAWIARDVWSDGVEAAWYDSHATTLRTAYDGRLWLAAQAAYSPARPEFGAPDAQTWTRWYPDSTTQVFPIRFGVIGAQSTRARNLWSVLNRKWPAWTGCQMNGEPFSEVGHAAAISRDKQRAGAYLQNCLTRWAPHFPWPYNVRHAGIMAETAALAGAL